MIDLEELRAALNERARLYEQIGELQNALNLALDENRRLRGIVEEEFDEFEDVQLPLPSASEEPDWLFNRTPKKKRYPVHFKADEG